MRKTDCRLMVGDCIQLLEMIPAEHVDLTLSDIPFGISHAEWDVLHNNSNSALGGQSPAQKRMGAGFKRRGKPINGWSKADLERPKEYEEWCARWTGQLLRVVKPGASVLLFGGRRTIHRAVVAMENAGFHLRDLLCWAKPGTHFRAQRLSDLLRRRGRADEAAQWRGWRLGSLAPAFEPIAWFFKPYRIGRTIADNVLEFGVGAINVSASLHEGKVPTNLLRFDFSDGEAGFHQTQKPVALLEYLITLTTRPEQVVLDPFMGSGSTGVACAKLGRRFIGMEQDAAHVKTARQRIKTESHIR